MPVPDMIPVSSSNISTVGYDETENKLYIEFLHGGTYSYDDVPKATFEELRDADSVGSFFHNNIKNGGFSYKKII